MASWREQGFVFTELCVVEYGISGIAKDEHDLFCCSTRHPFVNEWNKIWKIIDFQPCELSNYTGELQGMISDGDLLYMCNRKTGQIISFSKKTKKISIVAGSGIVGHKDGALKEAQFNKPTRITMDKKRNLYVTEEHCVRKIDLTQGNVETVAGTTISGYQDGDAKTALFNNPWGIAVTSDGTIYVGDCDNQCVRQIKDGVVSTFAGTPDFECFDFELVENVWRPHDIALTPDGKDLVICDVQCPFRIVFSLQLTLIPNYGQQLVVVLWILMAPSTLECPTLMLCSKQRDHGNGRDGSGLLI